MKRVMIALIKGYQWILSPLSGPQCRFHPTCSTYAVQAIERFGPLKGGWLAARRIASCHPWSRRPAIDPVPSHHHCHSRESGNPEP
ncbi:membrane protein insertion efficiency factor YidD [Micavibrio aeruginosavorus]|uniref:Putative membrane protein insertion efficiency factor n=1 Tax=Micavibrio aeruginosavorus (strain ARL-13) TaxID=856793 RepID=G2KMM0_MICAA|nr:membrane protein insertion efficiency factor YidD [Micavibrio aeruginosavorus]AEP10713.1 conserved hypothetical protein [Micavibrio aeruginosavorus ARL-13]